MIFRAIGRLTIQLLTSLGRFIAGLIRGFIRRPFRGILSLALIGAVIFTWFYFNGFGIFSSSSVVEGQVSESRVSATNTLMVGLTNLDAEKIWSSLDPGFQLELKNKGIDSQKMQQTFDTFKTSAKLNYIGYVYKGTGTFSNSNNTDSYTAVVRYQDSRVAEVSYLLLVDASGKIVAVGTNDPFLLAGIGRSQQQQAQQQGQ